MDRESDLPGFPKRFFLLMFLFMFLFTGFVVFLEDYFEIPSCCAVTCAVRCDCSESAP